LRDAAVRDRIPDPQAVRTFEDSKLSWDEAALTPNAEVLRLYSNFLLFRRQRLKNRHRSSWTLDQVSSSTIVLRYQNRDDGDILILAQLISNEVQLSSDQIAASPGKTWKFAMSSNESIYGGSGPGKFNERDRRFLLSQPELIIFTEENTVSE
jgi:hypothetical protein